MIAVRRAIEHLRQTARIDGGLEGGRSLGAERPTIYGAMLTAWSAGGIVGPILIASFGTTAHPDYVTPVYIIAGIMLVSIPLPFVARELARRRGDTVEAPGPAS